MKQNILYFCFVLFYDYYIEYGEILASLEGKNYWISSHPSNGILNLGFVMHYFFVASFFWVNVMSFDIWRTFRHIRGISKNPGVKSDNHRKFIYYSVYAWGSSLVVSAITILMESLPESMTENLMTPNIGVHSCFFQERYFGFYSSDVRTFP